jgi:hypothetical protein
LPEIAVLAGIAHPALAAEICADLGVRREPLHDESRINSARAAKTPRTSRPPGVVVHLVQGPEPGAAGPLRPLTGPFRAHVRHRAFAGPPAAAGGEPAAKVVRIGK